MRCIDLRRRVDGRSRESCESRVRIVMGDAFAVALSTRARILLERQEEAQHEDAAALPASLVAPQVRAAVEDALARGETHYTDRPGLLGLRQQAASQLARRFGIAADAKADVVITCGVTEARFVAVQQLLAPGEFLAAPIASERLFGAALLRGALLSEAIGAGTRLVYLASSTPESALRGALAEAPESATILFEVDEAASGFHPAQLPGFATRTATIGSLGSESWRLGYLLSPSVASPGMREFKQALTICSTNLSQWAGVAALQAGEESF